MKPFLKSIIFTILSLVFCAGSFAQPFKITGKITGKTRIGKVICMIPSADAKLTKTIEAKVSNGQYTLSGTIDEPCIIFLRAESKVVDDSLFNIQENGYALYLVPGDVLLQSNKNLGNTQASGNGAKWNKDYQYMAKQLQVIADSCQKMSFRELNIFTKTVMYKKGKAEPSYGLKEYNRDSATVVKLKYLGNGGLDSMFNYGVLIPFIKKYPASPLAFWALESMGGSGPKAIKYDLQYPLFEHLSPEVRALSAAKPFKEKLDKLNAVQSGKVAPVFKLTDTLSQELSLSALKGKYVLLDFWAHWCGPCRAEFPNLHKIYGKYKSDNFEILGVSVSLSTSRSAWKKAILEENADWLHLYDDKSEVAKLYSITSIPKNFLIDPKGVIIAVNLHGDDLEKKLKEIFGK